MRKASIEIIPLNMKILVISLSINLFMILSTNALTVTMISFVQEGSSEFGGQYIELLLIGE